MSDKTGITDSDILSNILSGICSDILSGIYADILSGIQSDILSDTYFFAFYLAFYSDIQFCHSI